MKINLLFVSFLCVVVISIPFVEKRVEGTPDVVDFENDLMELWDAISILSLTDLLKENAKNRDLIRFPGGGSEEDGWGNLEDNIRRIITDSTEKNETSSLYSESTSIDWADDSEINESYEKEPDSTSKDNEESEDGSITSSHNGSGDDKADYNSSSFIESSSDPSYSEDQNSYSTDYSENGNDNYSDSSSKIENEINTSESSIHLENSEGTDFTTSSNSSEGGRDSSSSEVETGYKNNSESSADESHGPGDGRYTYSSSSEASTDGSYGDSTSTPFSTSSSSSSSSPAEEDGSSGSISSSLGDNEDSTSDYNENSSLESDNQLKEESDSDKEGNKDLFVSSESQDESNYEQGSGGQMGSDDEELGQSHSSDNEEVENSSSSLGESSDEIEQSRSDLVDAGDSSEEEEEEIIRSSSSYKNSDDAEEPNSSDENYSDSNESSYVSDEGETESDSILNPDENTSLSRSDDDSESNTSQYDSISGVENDPENSRDESNNEEEFCDQDWIQPDIDRIYELSNIRLTNWNEMEELLNQLIGHSGPTVRFSNITLQWLQQHGVSDTTLIRELENVKESLKGTGMGLENRWWYSNALPFVNYKKILVAQNPLRNLYSEANVGFATELSQLYTEIEKSKCNCFESHQGKPKCIRELANLNRVGISEEWNVCGLWEGQQHCYPINKEVVCNVCLAASDQIALHLIDELTCQQTINKLCGPFMDKKEGDSLGIACRGVSYLICRHEAVKEIGNQGADRKSVV